jgi:hypothetical protein
MGFGISPAGIQATIYSSIQGGLTAAASKGIKSLTNPATSLSSAVAASNAQGNASQAPLESRITLEYIPPSTTSTPSQSVQSTQSNIAAATPQRPPYLISASTASAPAPAPARSLLAFDVSIYTSDAIAEAMTETLRASQITHKTAAGFYVDEWGPMPGSLEIISRVIFRSNLGPSAPIQAVRAWFQQTKRITPFALGGPGIVRFHDSYSGISLQLNMMDISLQRTSDDPMRGLLTIHAEVIADLTNPQLTSSPSIIPPTSSAVTAASLFAFSNSTLSVNGSAGTSSPAAAAAAVGQSFA